MEEPLMIILDTDVIIELFKNNPKIKEKIAGFNLDELAISVITAAEILHGAINKTELARINKHLALYRILDVNEEISVICINLMKKYCLSHRPFVQDLFIASTSLYHESELFTLNIKDFRYIENIKLVVL
jgi:predicted nucleic acid-binding protein